MVVRENCSSFNPLCVHEGQSWCKLFRYPSNESRYQPRVGSCTEEHCFRVRDSALLRDGSSMDKWINRCPIRKTNWPERSSSDPSLDPKIIARVKDNYHASSQISAGCILRRFLEFQDLEPSVQSQIGSSKNSNRNFTFYSIITSF